MANKQTSIKDPDLAKVGVALKRAALKAKQLGFATNTPVYVFRDGKIVDIVAEQCTTQRTKKVRSNGSGIKKPRNSQKTSQKGIDKSR